MSSDDVRRDLVARVRQRIAEGYYDDPFVLAETAAAIENAIRTTPMEVQGDEDPD